MGNKSIIFSIILGLLLGISTLLSILFAFSVVNEGWLISWCYALIGIAVVATLGFSLFEMITNLKKAKSALFGIVVLAIIFAVSYFMSTNEIHTNVDGDVLADAFTSKLSEGGIIAFYILIVVTIGTIIISEVSKIFK